MWYILRDLSPWTVRHADGFKDLFVNHCVPPTKKKATWPTGGEALHSPAQYLLWHLGSFLREHRPRGIAPTWRSCAGISLLQKPIEDGPRGLGCGSRRPLWELIDLRDGCKFCCFMVCLGFGFVLFFEPTLFENEWWKCSKYWFGEHSVYMR